MGHRIECLLYVKEKLWHPPALCQLLSAAMTLICPSRLSSIVSIFSTLLPLVLEPCASIPVTCTVLT